MIRKARSSLCLSFLSTSTTTTHSTASVGSSTSTSSSSSCRSTFLASTTIGSCEPMEEWLYWQRDEARKHCWTKVFAVLQDEFLLFFQQGSKRPKSLLLQIAVATVEVSGDRTLRIVDPNGEGLEIYLIDVFYECDVKSLPRNSAHRGSLVAARRVKTRTKCKQAIVRLALKWRQSLVREGDRHTL